MTTATSPRSAHGHTITVNDRHLDVDTTWNGYDAEDLHAVAVWTHDLTDTEAVDVTRVYLEGQFKTAFGDPYEEFGVDPDETWPEPGDDLAKHVRRVWARWPEKD